MFSFVHDLFIRGYDEQERTALKQKLTVKKSSSVLGKAAEFLGVKIYQGYDYIAMIQKNQVQALVAELGLTKRRQEPSHAIPL